jgi:Reeler domain
MLRLIFFAASFLGVQSYSSGATDCKLPNHGTFKTPLPTDWTLSLLDSTGTSVTQWTAGKTYTAQIQATSTSFKGWSWAALKGSPTSFTSGSATMAGTFATADSYSHVNSGCPGSLTQTSATSRTLIKAAWTPPAAGTGTVSLWSMMIISKNGNNYNAVLVVPEAGASGPSVTGTATGSKGASTSATPTTLATPSSSVTAQTRASVVHAVVAPAPVASPIPASTAVMAIAIGSGLGGVALAVIFASVLAVMRRNNNAKKVMSFSPTVIRVSPLHAAV